MNFDESSTMAKYLSLSTSDQRGKLGGTVYARNRYGTYLRGLGSPVNPRSTAQVQARNVLEAFSIGWRTIGSIAQTAWNSVAGTVTWFDSLGQPYHPSGFALFVSANANIELIAGSAITEPLTYAAPPARTPTLVVTGSVTAMHVTAGHVDTIERNYLAVYAVPPSSAGKTFYRPSDFRFMAAAPGADEFGNYDIDITAAYAAYFGALPVAGSRIAVRARVIDSESGYSSAYGEVLHDFA